MARIAVIANPLASRLTRRRVETVRQGLQGEHKVDLHITRAAGHAAELADDAVADGADAVVVVGGDGTLAETFAPLVGAGAALGVVPAGGTNVLARSLGISERTGPAVAQLRRCLRLGPRRLGLGRAGENWFGFVAGLGIDAAAVRLVEQRPRLKRALGSLLYAASAVEAYARADRLQPALSLCLPDGTSVDGIHNLIVANSSPYTFLGPWPITLTPYAHLDLPLEVAGFRRTDLGFTLRMLGAAFAGGRGVWRDPDVVGLSGLARIEVRADPPVDLHLDGDHHGQVSAVAFSFHPEAVSFLA